MTAVARTAKWGGGVGATLVAIGGVGLGVQDRMHLADALERSQGAVEHCDERYERLVNKHFDAMADREGIVAAYDEIEPDIPPVGVQEAAPVDRWAEQW